MLFDGFWDFCDCWMLFYQFEWFTGSGIWFCGFTDFELTCFLVWFLATGFGAGCVSLF